MNENTRAGNPICGLLPTEIDGFDYLAGFALTCGHPGTTSFGTGLIRI